MNAYGINLQQQKTLLKHCYHNKIIL